MKQFNKKILAASIVLALGLASSAWADTDISKTVTDSFNTKDITKTNTDISKTATATDSFNTKDITKTDTTTSTDNSKTATDSFNTKDITKTNTDTTTTSTNNSDNSVLTASGAGSAVSRNGDAYASYEYKVNNSDLSGTVTGSSVSIDGGHAKHAEFVAKNDLSNAFNGSAGINQSVQNSAPNALAQQQVSFQGNVNVNQPTVAP